MKRKWRECTTVRWRVVCARLTVQLGRWDAANLKQRKRANGSVCECVARGGGLLCGGERRKHPESVQGRDAGADWTPGCCRTNWRVRVRRRTGQGPKPRPIEATPLESVGEREREKYKESNRENSSHLHKNTDTDTYDITISIKRNITFWEWQTSFPEFFRIGNRNDSKVTLISWKKQELSELDLSLVNREHTLLSLKLVIRLENKQAWRGGGNVSSMETEHLPRDPSNDVARETKVH